MVWIHVRPLAKTRINSGGLQINLSALLPEHMPGQKAEALILLTKVRAMLERQNNYYGWEFVFLGANIDAFETVALFGISQTEPSTIMQISKGRNSSMRWLVKRLASYATAKWYLPIENNALMKTIKNAEIKNSAKILMNHNERGLAFCIFIQTTFFRLSIYFHTRFGYNKRTKVRWMY